MRGELHKRLVAEILANINGEEGLTQESLSKAVQMHQTTVSGILKRNAGTFDLDEAAAALEHIGSTLPRFLAGEPPRDLTATEMLARALATRPELVDLVIDLLPVPKQKLADVIELARGFGRLSSRRRGGRTPGSDSSPTQARRTTKGPAKRR
jgi:hypothetical protein